MLNLHFFFLYYFLYTFLSYFRFDSFKIILKGLLYFEISLEFSIHIHLSTIISEFFTMWLTLSLFIEALLSYSMSETSMKQLGYSRYLCKCNWAYLSFCQVRHFKILQTPFKFHIQCNNTWFYCFIWLQMTKFKQTWHNFKKRW